MSQKPLVLPDIRSRAGAFVADWRDAEGYERGEAQEFVRGLLGVFGVSGRTAAVYEKRAQRSTTGHRGYIDALISGTALIEMKSAGEDLEKAEQQALDYMGSLTENEMPGYIITSDFKRFRLLNLQPEPDEQAVIEFSLEQLPKHVEKLLFLAGYRRTSFGSAEQEAASIKAAQLMAKLYEHLEATGYDDHQASIFLIRTLFCLYADDAALWERDLFSRWIEERTSEDGSDLGAQLATLYQALNRPEEKRYGQSDDLLMAFPYVNGSVFGEAVDIPYFDRASRELLLQASYFNWSSISPAIFGSLFQAVKDKKARRSLGEHYTTETNILKVIRPLFLDELEQRFEKARARKGELEKLLDHLASLTFLDPAFMRKSDVSRDIDAAA
ncbi:type IIL restriction-modification enzyme MmeI [Brachybacterium paraconglomeratum]